MKKIIALLCLIATTCISASTIGSRGNSWDNYTQKQLLYQAGVNSGTPTTIAANITAMYAAYGDPTQSRRGSKFWNTVLTTLQYRAIPLSSVPSYMQYSLGGRAAPIAPAGGGAGPAPVVPAPAPVVPAPAPVVPAPAPVVPAPAPVVPAGGTVVAPAASIVLAPAAGAITLINIQGRLDKLQLPPAINTLNKNLWDGITNFREKNADGTFIADIRNAITELHAAINNWFLKPLNANALKLQDDLNNDTLEDAATDYQVGIDSIDGAQSDSRKLAFSLLLQALIDTKKAAQLTQEVRLALATINTSAEKATAVTAITNAKQSFAQAKVDLQNLFAQLDAQVSAGTITAQDAAQQLLDESVTSATDMNTQLRAANTTLTTFGAWQRTIMNPVLANFDQIRTLLVIRTDNPRDIGIQKTTNIKEATDTVNRMLAGAALSIATITGATTAATTEADIQAERTGSLSAIMPTIPFIQATIQSTPFYLYESIGCSEPLSDNNNSAIRAQIGILKDNYAAGANAILQYLDSYFAFLSQDTPLKNGTGGYDLYIWAPEVANPAQDIYLFKNILPNPAERNPAPTVRIQNIINVRQLQEVTGAYIGWTRQPAQIQRLTPQPTQYDMYTANATLYKIGSLTNAEVQALYGRAPAPQPTQGAFSNQINYYMTRLVNKIPAALR